MSIDKAVVESLSIAASLKLGPPQQTFIFFADMCGSTEFKTYCKANLVPPGAWMERQLVFLHRIISTVGRFSGNVVKTIGDEVMAYFTDDTPSATVLKCATDCHALFGDIQRYDNDVWRIRHKVSVDYGEVYDSNFGLIPEGGLDPVGIAVDRCARLNEKGRPDEVLLSSSFFAMLDAQLQAKYSKYMESDDLKGAGISEFYRIMVGNVPARVKGD